MGTQIQKGKVVRGKCGDTSTLWMKGIIIGRELFVCVCVCICLLAISFPNNHKQKQKQSEHECRQLFGFLCMSGLTGVRSV